MAVARRFHLARELGVGSFGAVYLAEMESAGGFRRKVALKLLRPELDQVSDASRRLRDEARLLGRLRHRHIVQVDDLIRVNGRWAVVMEYVPGFDLEQLLLGLKAIDAPFPPLAAVQVTRAVALALDAAYTGRAGGEEPLRVVPRGHAWAGLVPARPGAVGACGRSTRAPPASGSSAVVKTSVTSMVALAVTRSMRAWPLACSRRSHRPSLT